MAGWHQDNEEPRRKLSAMLGRRDRIAQLPEPVADEADVPEVQAPGLREERMRHVVAYIGEYPEDGDERIRCNRALHEQPERAA
jgi:hypothetical protein